MIEVGSSAGMTPSPSLGPSCSPISGERMVAQGHLRGAARNYDPIGSRRCTSLGIPAVAQLCMPKVQAGDRPRRVRLRTLFSRYECSRAATLPRPAARARPIASYAAETSGTCSANPRNPWMKPG